MAPRGGKARAGAGRGRGRGKGRGRPRPSDDAPDAFRGLLSEAGNSTQDSRPLKRRRIAAKSRDEPKQTIVDDSPNTDSDSESEVEFEDVYLGPLPITAAPAAAQEPLHITLENHAHNAKDKRNAAGKRKPVTVAEKARRLSCHKMHIVFLLYHAFYRNHWCNDAKTQAILKSLPQPRLITMLHPASSATQTQRSRLFKDALTQICDLWYVKFNITAVGMRRPQWYTAGDGLAQFKLSPRAEKPLELADFRRAAKSLQGSADLGAELFCALLRALGVEARLVVSLQPLGFAAAAELATPQKKPNGKITVYANASDEEQDSHQPASKDASIASPTPVRRIGRIGQSRSAATASADLGKPPPALFTKAKRVQRPAHPIFWVEAFDEASQQWIAVDSMATKSVNKPAQIEPAFNDPQNSMSYVIAFDEDGTAKDVTRRYTKAYNAKTRKLRVESTEGGQRWLKRILKPFRKYRLQDRDQIEDADLAAKEAAEGMPRNVQDFKDHPYYALERHLKRNEVLHPKQEAGRINIGTSSTTRFETVYRRRDVHVVRSSDRWFRLGRQLKIGEQPLKYVRARQIRGRESSADPDAEEAQTALFAMFQTELYIPDPVIDGRVPKNAFGNLDVYVPSMVPPGAVHIRDLSAKNAARLLNIDYADAVTGFNFRGRHGTAVIEGVIVASEFRAAIDAVLDGMTFAKEEAMEASRSAECLRLWRRFLVGMRIVQRVKGYRREGEGEEEDRLADEDFQNELEQEMAQYRDRSPEPSGGGFLVGVEEEEMPVRAARISRRRLPSEGPEDDSLDDDDYNDGGGGGFVPSDESESEGVAETRNGVPTLVRETSLFGLENFHIPAAGRLPEDEQDDYGGGGFMVDEDDEDVHIPQGILTESSAGSVSVPTGRLASPPVVVDQGSPVDENIVANDRVEIGPQEPLMEEPDVPDTQIPETVASPIIPVVSQSLLNSDSNISEVAPARAVNETRPSQPSPAASSSSSSGFGDDLLPEDPEDEDAEPEWLL